MSDRQVFMVLGVVAAGALVVYLLDRNRAPVGAVSLGTAAAVTTGSLGWLSPLLPLQLNQSVSQSQREAPKQV
jgi:hypothetical protein